jgi:hypothetical protein
MYKNGQGKAVHNYQFNELKANGWSFSNDSSLVKKEMPSFADLKKDLSRNELAESLGISMVGEDGKKLHYKLIDSAIKEALADEHHEG